MPSKYRIILEMASQTARDIASNADRYTDFLITAANNYKYSFKEQLLIHAQKPDATACAEIDTWNKLGRWVNKGTKGIALLIDRDVPYKLRHVFDISDTNSRAGRNITLWQMKPEYEYAVSESLQASFGDVEEPRDFPHLLMDISGYAVEDNLSDYLMELNAVKAGSFLEELDDTNLEAWLKTTLKSSVAFMALSRAGYEPRQYFGREDFGHLFDFNTVEVISVLGAAVSDISEMVIREMGETVKEMEKEEKRKIRTFAQAGTSAYHKNRTENKERSNEHGTDLYDAGRLSDSRSDRAGEPKLGKYGMLRRTFLREHRDGIYTGMLLNGTLNSHLEEVDRQAQKMLDDLTAQMKALNGVTEQLKAEDQMRWVQMMNSIRHSAEEVILNDLIYA